MNDPSIDILTQRLAEADIDPQLRDSLASDLDWAAAINGNPDPAQQGIKRMVVSGVRRELLAAARDHKTQSSIASIVDHCRSRHKEDPAAEGTSDEVPEIHAGGKITLVMTTIRVLTPWRWPLAIAACSPWSASFIQAVSGIFQK